MMTLLNRIIFLQNIKDELIEKTKDPKVSYAQTVEIYKELRRINIELQHIRQQ
ncbi:hypothetical protein [Aneurinibacillus sp. REN35]|uniref:hypothetical protein n=1 Tax=Aneurinibacillus sp. REN35 TaxID=3237286 RepID=UPI0035289494